MGGEAAEYLHLWAVCYFVRFQRYRAAVGGLSSSRSAECGFRSLLG